MRRTLASSKIRRKSPPASFLEIFISRNSISELRKSQMLVLHFLESSNQCVYQVFKTAQIPLHITHKIPQNRIETAQIPRFFAQNRIDPFEGSMHLCIEIYTLSLTLVHIRVFHMRTDQHAARVEGLWVISRDRDLNQKIIKIEGALSINRQHKG